MNNIQVSVVIVCMNNLKKLYPCLDSIKKYTTVRYETLIVAYLFSNETLQKLREDYPWITIIESNEIRGFSENNNLALYHAKGEYCFVLNDDTYFESYVIDDLVSTIEKLPNNVAVISPKILNQDGSIQCCGRPKYNCWTYLLSFLRMLKFYEKHSKYVNKSGVFQSYNILGAAFLIKTEIFKKIGWFDERYFFCPEDIALSTLLNQKGYECFVNSDIFLVHYGGSTRSDIQTATSPSEVKGWLILYGNKWHKRVIIKLMVVFFRCMYMFCWLVLYLCGNSLAINQYRMNKNIIVSLFNKLSAKETFIKYYINK
jgi:GT2 family glycosyltransferase